MELSCRFYEAELPEVGDVVLLQVHQITEMGVLGHLVEYNDHEGLILYQELSNRRIRSIHKLVRVGMLVWCMVLRVDTEKGYIDLSRRHVGEKEREECRQKYAQANCVNVILCRAAQLLNFTTSQLEQLYVRTAWAFERGCEQYGAAYCRFRDIAANPQVLDEVGNLSEEERRVLVEVIQTRLGLTEVRIQCSVAVTCFTSEGIDAIKEALMAGKSLSTESVPLKVQLVSSPVFSISTVTVDQTEGIKVITKALAKIKESIERSRGKFEIRAPPKVHLLLGNFHEEEAMCGAPAANPQTSDDLRVWSAG